MGVSYKALGPAALAKCCMCFSVCVTVTVHVLQTCACGPGRILRHRLSPDPRLSWRIMEPSAAIALADAFKLHFNGLFC